MEQSSLIRWQGGFRAAGLGEEKWKPRERLPRRRDWGQWGRAFEFWSCGRAHSPLWSSNPTETQWVMAKDHVWLSDPIFEVPRWFSSLWFKSHRFLPHFCSQHFHWAGRHSEWAMKWEGGLVPIPPGCWFKCIRPLDLVCYRKYCWSNKAGERSLRQSGLVGSHGLPPSVGRGKQGWPSSWVATWTEQLCK